MTMANKTKSPVQRWSADGAEYRACLVAGHGKDSTSARSLRKLRCKPGDLVMIVRAKNKAFLGRVGTVICATSDAAELVHPEDLSEVTKRDWVVEMQGGPDTYFRDGLVVITHRLACADRCLMPIGASATQSEECAVDMPAEVAQ